MSIGVPVASAPPPAGALVVALDPDVVALDPDVVGVEVDFELPHAANTTTAQTRAATRACGHFSCLIIYSPFKEASCLVSPSYRILYLRSWYTSWEDA